VTDRPALAAPKPKAGVTTLLVLLALAGPAAFVMLSEGLAGASPPLTVSIVEQLLYCGFAAGLMWSALRIECAPVSSLGLRWPTWQTLALAAAMLVVGSFVLPLFTTPLWHRFSTADVEEGVRRLSLLPIWFRLVMAITGGALEETLYRGYATERLVSLTGRPWLAGMLAALGFGLAHIPAWGSAYALAVDLPFGIFMTIVYLWRRDLTANILAHSSGLVLGMLGV
jgi:membrane protease YdiL (CAAX protease family)